MTGGGAPRVWNRSRTAEVVAAALLLALAVAGFFAVPHLVSGWAFIMPGTTDASLAPTFFPRLAMILLGLCATGVIVSAPARSDAVPLVTMNRQDWLRIGAVLGLVILYALALRVVGFAAASVIFIAVMPAMLGYRRLRVLLPVALLAPLLIALAFRYGLKVLLPAGWWGSPF